MNKIKIARSEILKLHVDERVGKCGHGTDVKYVGELLRRGHDRLQLRDLLLAGAKSKPAQPVTVAYFQELRARLEKAGKRRAEE